MKFKSLKVYFQTLFDKFPKKRYDKMNVCGKI